jgi:inosine-uridine nucleoside N-ribohydrolase
MTTPPKLLILDTDPGVDDALALLYLRARADLRLLAITTVFGNADVGTTTRNALWLRRKLGLVSPIHAGAGAPLIRARGAAPVHVHGENGLGDIDLSGPPLPQADPGAAHERIIALVRAHPGQVTIVAIGPLTNLALALRAAPDIAPLVAGVTIMGGAFSRGNVTPHAEANIHSDPEAAAEVLAAAWPVTLVPLDATLPCVLTDGVARDLAARSDAGRLAHQVSRDYAAAYARHEGLAGCVLHDVCAMISLTRPDDFVRRQAPVTVVTDGDQVGRTAWASEGRAVSICVETRAAPLLDHFVETIAGSRPLP